MPPTAELEAWLKLGLVPGLGDASVRKLLSVLGSPEQALAASYSTLTGIVGENLARRIQAGCPPDAVKVALDWLASSVYHHLVTLADSAYPARLLQTFDPPTMLYVKGRVELLQQPAIAIVGSRNATPQGEANAEAFAQLLSQSGLTVVSGLALGIDAAAHRGGLAGGAGSLAVVGTGLDRVYPARNRALAHQLAERGAIVSEFPLGTPALGANFPRRNRIISGLSLGCLVVEAALSSGSLITARLAAEHGREVFAIPGSIHSTLSKGCHRLIKQGAKLVESAQDILEELSLPTPSVAPATPAEAHSDEDPLLRHVSLDPEPIDSIVARSGMRTEAVLAGLLRLELAGLVAAVPGGKYQRLIKRN